MSHPKEKASYELGRALYFHRVGAWDFSCASCHGDEGKRIRMQELPVLYKPEAARPVIASSSSLELIWGGGAGICLSLVVHHRSAATPTPHCLL